MRYVIQRIRLLATEYLHQDGETYAWKDHAQGRPDFSAEEAQQITQIHGGMAVPVMIDPPPPPKRKRAEPEPPGEIAPPVPTHPPDGWATRWEKEHDL